MLIEIWCDKFRQKKVEFKEGLNVILGAETGDNSIGKSTFLLIIDFVFGGNTYANNVDIRNNVGEHDVFFAFKFGEEVFKFCRNNCNNSQYVWKCDDAYNKKEKVALADFNRWLAERYKIALPDL
ncbi:MAG: AAA family ATPase, partial [Thermoguttaceae bacterium]|nr:AAA family ATPase [Thermoguttaceae bacterium]